MEPSVTNVCATEETENGNDPNSDGDCIVATRVEIGDEEQMKTDAKDALQQALNEDDLHVENVQGEIFTGNHHGLTFARKSVEHKSFQSRVQTLEDEVKTLKNGKVATDQQILSMENRIQSMTTVMDAYKSLRNRFISRFKRDKLKTATNTDFQYIGEGNTWAHGGDAFVDAQLYQSGEGRRDYSTFKKLYGLLPSVVRDITYQPTINALNTYASIIASKHRTGNDAFHQKFADYVAALEASEFNDEYLEDGQATLKVSQCYWVFMSCLEKDVERIEAEYVEV